LLTHGPFVKQTWAKDLDGNGRPIVLANTDPTPDGVVLFPSGAGATNWWPSTYAPEPGLLLVPALEQGGLYYSGNHAKPRKGELYEDGAGEERPDKDSYADVVAINPRDASVVWRHRLALKRDYSFSTGGLMSTSGGLVFGSLDQLFYALNTSTGSMAWQFHAGGAINAAPISYQADGVQYVAVAAGSTVIAFSLLDPPVPAGRPSKSGSGRGF
jgi:outer membrane protein assembly factor BamB